jgi:osmotically inducible protein OsmC
MPVREADAVWNGNLMDGRGNMRFGGGAFEGAYSFGSRFEEGVGTNPEELIAAAHAGCFSMAFAHGLAQVGYEPVSVRTSARVRLEKLEAGFTITTIELNTTAKVPGIDKADFQKQAEEAKAGCPVSRALTGVKVELKANLTS